MINNFQYQFINKYYKNINWNCTNYLLIIFYHLILLWFLSMIILLFLPLILCSLWKILGLFLRNQRMLGMRYHCLPKGPLQTLLCWLLHLSISSLLQRESPLKVRSQEYKSRWLVLMKDQILRNRWPEGQRQQKMTSYSQRQRKSPT